MCIRDSYTTEYFAKYAKQLEEMGADSICIKDMAGLLKPYDAYDLVKALKSTVKEMCIRDSNNSAC